MIRKLVIAALVAATSSPLCGSSAPGGEGQAVEGPSGAGAQGPLVGVAQSLDAPERARFESEVAALDAALAGDIGFAFVDLRSGESFTGEGDAVFPQASLIKLCVLLELYRQDQEGKLDLSQPAGFPEEAKVGGEGVLQLLRADEARLSARNLALLMMTISDNTAANVLIDRVGMESVNRRMESWGLEATRLHRRMMDLGARQKGVENLSTPKEMVTLLRLLHEGVLLDPGRTREVLDTMGRIQGSPFRRHLPETLSAPHKDGSLEGIRTGAGFLLIPGRPVAWAIMARDLRDEPAAEEGLARLLRAAYDYFSTR